ncbi:MAG: hypothetical protein WBA13_03915 [Microcoleaceae cyanobacterium]
MSKFQISMLGLIIAALSTGSVAWIKQIQQKNLNQVQLKRIKIEVISKNDSPESLKKARKQTKIYLKQLEQTPVIPLIAQPSEQFKSEQYHLSIKLEEINQVLATLESSLE